MKVNQLALAFLACFSSQENQYVYSIDTQQTDHNEDTANVGSIIPHHQAITDEANSKVNNNQQGYIIRTYSDLVTDEDRSLHATTATHDRKLEIDLSVLTEFKHLHELKEDALFDFQVIDDAHMFSAKGKKYSLDGLEPVKVYTDDATLMMDGEVLSEMPHYDPHVFTGTDGSDTIMVSTKEGANGKQEIDTIDVMGVDGSPDVHLATVLPGLLTTIRPEDIDASEDDVKFDFDEEDYGDDFSLERDDEEMGSYLDGSDNDDMYNKKNNFGGRKMLRKSNKKATNRELQSTGCSSFEVIEMAIVFDSTFCAKDGRGFFSRARQEAENIVAQASVFFQRQGVCGKVEIKHLEGYCNVNSDPYRGIVRNGDMSCKSATSIDILRNFRSFWSRNRSNISRDSAHLFFNDRKGGAIGCASVNVICSKDRGYGVNDMSTSSSTFRKAILFAHELGHNAGLSHTSGSNSIMASSLIRSTAPQWTSTSVSRLKSNLPRFSCLATENNTPTPPTRPTPTPPTPPTRPTPGGILNNYNFVPFMDSNGNDIRNQSGGIEVVARACSSDPRCKGFNSNGWMKHTLMDRSRWTRWTNDSSKGFYVKKQSVSPTPPTRPTPTPPTPPTSNQYMQLKTQGRCVGIRGNSGSAKRVNGARVILESCRSSWQSQQWKHDSLGRFVNKYSGKCISVGSRGILYDKAYIWSCSDTKMYYRWDKLSNGKYRNKGHRSFYLGVAYCGDRSKVGYLELRRLESSGVCHCSQTWNNSC